MSMTRMGTCQVCRTVYQEPVPLQGDRLKVFIKEAGIKLESQQVLCHCSACKGWQPFYTWYTTYESD